MLFGKYIKNSLVILVSFIVCCFLVLDFVSGESRIINVHLTVPSSGGGGGGPMDTTPPVISNIVVIPDYTTGTVSWTATDETQMNVCLFDYGLTELYGSVANPLQNGDDFSVDLFNLSTGTVYYFMINCLDTSNNSAIATGTLTTLSLEFFRDLIIVARPEKRIFKSEGNYQSNAYLLLYNNITKELEYLIEVDLDKTGTTTIQINDLLTGNYEAAIKTESHLAKRIVNVVIENDDDPVLDFSEALSFYLLAGDVQGTGLKDNFVDILDISATDIKFNSTDPIFDLNRDNIVDVLDMSIVLVNYNKQGDPI